MTETHVLRDSSSTLEHITVLIQRVKVSQPLRRVYRSLFRERKVKAYHKVLLSE